MRLRSDIWVGAYLRRIAVEGAFAALRRRGAAEAGAIYIKIDRLDGRVALFEPGTAVGSRRARRGAIVDPRAQGRVVGADTVEARMAREIAFDPDLSLIEVEDRAGRCWLDLATS